jgi:hypothetical protein
MVVNSAELPSRTAEIAPRYISAAKLRAQRGNAKRSTGPRTKAGKFRSALNGQIRRLLPEAMERELRARGEDPREFCRLHRDLIAIFRPRHAEIAMGVMMLASAWWQKARRIRQWVGSGPPQSAELDARIEALLRLIVSEMQGHNRHWKTALTAVVGTTIGAPAEVRRQIEERLTLFGAKGGALMRQRAAGHDEDWDDERIRKRIEDLIAEIVAEAGKPAGSRHSAGGSQPPAVDRDSAANNGEDEASEPSRVKVI